MTDEQIERWIGKHLSDETIENNEFDDWMGEFSERYSDNELNAMKRIFRNRKEEIEQAKIEAAKPEEDKVYNYHATAYRFYDCPTCDGVDDEAQIIFGNSLDDLMKHCKEYQYDKIYRNGNEIAGCIYKSGFHRIHKVMVCKLDKYWEPDENDVIKVYT